MVKYNPEDAKINKIGKTLTVINNPCKQPPFVTCDPKPKREPKRPIKHIQGGAKVIILLENGITVANGA